MIGAATHVLWDSLTHDNGWIVEHSSFLQLKLISWQGHSFQMYRLLWHFSTWIALLLLYRAYAQTLHGRTSPAESLSTDEKRRYALCAWLLGLPMKLDVAWATDLQDTRSPRWHFSIGPEF